MQNLKASLSHEDGEKAEGLIVIGGIQSPGIVILNDRELLLVPLVGTRLSIRLNDIQSVRQGRWLPGKWVWGKKAFNLGIPAYKRVAFAVAESIGKRWAHKIHSTLV